ncbi:UDP-glycosyltransferase 92A1 [Vitis vinifera]|uniref:UDP-glycosyltransferase 92A1 n=1 Tax=Vitis vinifera TaxID=29760 RepID=A0A438JVN3_VITVI|nr:UDP-glycosyltransferase 92A1 [Vitis vinifera]
MACYYSLWLNVPHPKPNSNGEFSLLDFPEASTIHVTQMSENLRAADGTDPYSEENWQAGLASGASSSVRRGAVQEPGTMVEFYKEWLNAKPSNSVLYIAFGSQNTLSASQMMQLAMALDVSGKSFIWVIRPPLGVDVESEFKAKEWLPEGFGQRIKDQNRGLLEQKWAPQVEILSHRSISAFLSHCGWNSVFEAVSHGVPIMGWPMSAEQFLQCEVLRGRDGGVRGGGQRPYV